MTYPANVHVQYAEALEEDAPDSESPCSEFVEAAEHWHKADEHERELAAVSRASELDDDRGPLSGRGAYIAHLLTHDRADEAAPLLDELRRKPSAVAMTYLDVHYGFATSGNVPKGLRWLNVGASHLIDSLDELLSPADPGYDLLLERRHARSEAGLPPDAMDEFFDRCAAHGGDVLSAIQAQHGAEDDHLSDLVDAQGNLALDRYALPLWTAEEFARSKREHPEWWEEDTTYDDYRRAVQRELGEVPVGACLVPTTVAAVEEFAAAAGHRAADPETPDDYAFEEAHAGRFLPWPPGRNEACWCGSGRKYKKCCGAPGFA
ncbi:SEC-C domain-containing protein [Saccharopolyspora rhizosphaerae]|uniref:SEC-C domain-containing protein n=1 Tax=Saccharopolyspora rhizosphaerae TaxID=2492662 RepID=A0A426JQA7_9PSEU|nr:SEC-C domain-containing protein [Saccharopolyspora rhizosphaerae]RRO15368.1 SEC-C domain-containing protein [Saccharopolyspora rhizosphaerae]